MAATDAVSYAWGQCTWFVDQALGWLHLKNGQGFTDAANWYRAAVNNRMQVSNVPQVGAVVVYKTPGAGVHTEATTAAGHVGVVTAINPNGTFQVASDNWGAPGLTHIGTSTLDEVQGFISPPNAQAGAAGAASALHMAGGGSPQAFDVALMGSTGNGPGQDPNSHFTFSNWNPFDPSSFLNLPGDVAGLTQVPGNIADSGGHAIGTVFDAFLNWFERGFIIIFGAIILFMGIWVLFKSDPGQQSLKMVSGAIGEEGEEGTSDTTEVVGQTTREERGPRGGKRGSVTTTHTRVVKGRAAKKGRGIRGALSSKGKGKAGVAEDAALA